MCQKLHGNFGSHSKAKRINLQITKDEGLGWYKTSSVARRGFCRNCGSSLFWDPYEQDSVGILAGSLSQPTGLKTMGHIFVGEKPDFYEITDDNPQFKNSSDGDLIGDYK
ncbi:MAG: GFA family protein [Acidiferrobacterales bacterium]|nr:GFA family protein [Acidiferrobacterales bacterium]